MTQVETIVVGDFAENCYLVEKQGSLLVIDPGHSPRRILARIAGSGADKVEAVLLTHGHEDHIGAVDEVVKQCRCPVYAAKADQRLFTDPRVNDLDGLFTPVAAAIHWLTGQTALTLGPFAVDIYYTPGHTAGSLTFAVGNDLFSGDTLFAGGVGRTDLFSGSDNQLKQSLALFSRFPLDMRVFPGHGPATTIGAELAGNPYLR